MMKIKEDLDLETKGNLDREIKSMKGDMEKEIERVKAEVIPKKRVGKTSLIKGTDQGLIHKLKNKQEAQKK